MLHEHFQNIETPRTHRIVFYKSAKKNPTWINMVDFKWCQCWKHPFVSEFLPARYLDKLHLWVWGAEAAHPAQWPKAFLAKQIWSGPFNQPPQITPNQLRLLRVYGLNPTKLTPKKYYGLINHTNNQDYNGYILLGARLWFNAHHHDNQPVAFVGCRKNGGPQSIRSSSFSLLNCWPLGYPLVMTNIAMENGNRDSWFAR